MKKFTFFIIDCLFIAIRNKFNFIFKGKNEIKIKKNQSDSNISNALSNVKNQNSEKIKIIYEQLQKTDDAESLRKFIDEIEIKVREIKTDIEQHIQKLNIRDALKDLKKLQDFKKDFSFLIKEIKNYFETSKDKIEKAFSQIYNFLNSRLKLSREIEELEAVDQRNFDNWIEFSEFKIEMTGKNFKWKSFYSGFKFFFTREPTFFRGQILL